eukprot:m.141178 g.141178  ORF g.141178 m.141178 type:complete len:302 (+) comp14962_c0_seq5:472-1377(+)
MSNLVVLAGLITAWYFCSLGTDLLNKEVQYERRIPSLLTAIQFLVGALASTALLRGARVYEFRPVSDVRAVLPLVSCWTLGFLTINFSFGQTAVSFTHAVRATEPLFLVATSVFVYHRTFTRKVYTSLVPIVLGIALVAMTDLSFAVAGFVSTCISNICFTTRSILAKDLFAAKITDEMTLFYYLSWLSFAATIPVALWFDSEVIFNSAFWTPRKVALLACNGFLHYSYNQLSFIVLTRMSPLGHTIGNAARRFFLIMCSVFYYNTHLTALNQFGTFLLLVGVAMYIAASQPPTKARPEPR